MSASQFKLCARSDDLLLALRLDSGERPFYLSRSGVFLLHTISAKPALALDDSILQTLDIASDGDAVRPAERCHEPQSTGTEHVELLRPLYATRVFTMLAVTVPPLAVVGVMLLAWGGWMTSVDLALLGSMYVLTALGVTIGFHRLYTHKSFATRGPIAAFFAICGSMSAQGPVIWWAAVHRAHHQHSDREQDPHSPHAGRAAGWIGSVRGFLHAHAGWLFADVRADLRRYVPDLLADATAVRINNAFPYIVVAGILLPGIVGGLITASWMGALLGTLWGGVVRIFVLHHVTWSINSVCHVWGAREYASGDHSRNNPIFGILAFGEGWHNNHHAFPASARHGLRWWQLDMSWLIIRSLERIGLAKKVRLPSPERLAARRG